MKLSRRSLFRGLFGLAGVAALGRGTPAAEATTKVKPNVLRWEYTVFDLSGGLAPGEVAAIASGTATGTLLYVPWGIRSLRLADGHPYRYANGEIREIT